ncbi:hypothetical protein LptCag_1686 [Leptospirillum ferriphilum]|uniref:Uncharacterized protein n=1 Tax=Leptospirillum ferriphilum TaxID=178606 RepID=A0A094WB10_9BACT|nr:hypothetical protein LptCag_1686 [Leptospirillum ferriphilum]
MFFEDFDPEVRQGLKVTPESHGRKSSNFDSGTVRKSDRKKTGPLKQKYQ